MEKSKFVTARLSWMINVQVAGRKGLDKKNNMSINLAVGLGGEMKGYEFQN